MKNRLLAQLPQHKTCLCSIYNPHLYIVDWKDYNKGVVEISGAQRNVINAVHILNENNVKVFLMDFLKMHYLSLKKSVLDNVNVLFFQ